MGRNRQFAKKTEEVRTFRLVSRSQNDDHFDEEDATPLVLEAFVAPNAHKRAVKNDVDLLSVPKALQGLGPAVFGPAGRDAFPEPKPKPKPSVVEQILASGQSDDEGEEDGEEEEDDPLAALEEDCYFPKDGYNYERHLKRVSGTGKGGAVGGVVLTAPLKLAEEVGAPTPAELYLQAAHTEEERELLRALEYADEYEDMDEGFADDFLAAGPAEEMDSVLFGPAALEARKMPDMEVFKAMHAKRIAAAEGDEEGEEEEEGEHEGPGGEGEAVNDEDFQKFLANEYGDEDLGEMEEEEIEGHLDIEDCQEVLDEYLQGRIEEEKKLLSIYEPQEGKRAEGALDTVPRVIGETKALVTKFGYDEIGDETYSDGEESDHEDRQWDVETVLSTLSNLSNRPGTIGRIKKAKPPKGPGLKPLGALTEGDEEKAERAAARAEESSEDEVVELPDVNYTRDPDETAEEKRVRKAGVKEMRKICRKMKKESKDTYKTEAAKLPGASGGNNGDVRQKLRVTKL